MTERDHLTWDQLLHQLEEPSSVDEVRSHLPTCEHCRDRLERLRAWLDALPQALDPGAPDTWIRRAQQRAVPRSFLRPMRGVYVAQVVFDSGEHQRVGIRSAGGGERQWLLATDRLEIEVTLSDPA